MARMSPQSLTPHTAGTLIAAHKAIHPTADTLLTRTTLYVWSPADTRWHPEHTGLKVVHSNPYRWHFKTQTFVRCDCAHCP